MQTGVLEKVFGRDKQWHGPCTLILDAEATIQATGTDAIVNAGNKMYAPRLISGRVNADSVCYLPDDAALVVVQWERIRQASVKDQFQQTVSVLDIGHVASLEFPDGAVLAALGLADPAISAATTARTSR